MGQMIFSMRKIVENQLNINWINWINWVAGDPKSLSKTSLVYCTTLPHLARPHLAVVLQRAGIFVAAKALRNTGVKGAIDGYPMLSGWGDWGLLSLLMSLMLSGDIGFTSFCWMVERQFYILARTHEQ